jgi:hypothetical protein
MHGHQRKETHQGTETEHHSARELIVSEKLSIHSGHTRLGRHTREGLEQPLMLHPHKCTSRKAQCETDHSCTCIQRGNRPASTPPNQTNRKPNRTEVNGKNLLLRETRDIWGHLGPPDRGELRASRELVVTNQNPHHRDGNSCVEGSHQF